MTDSIFNIGKPMAATWLQLLDIHYIDIKRLIINKNLLFYNIFNESIMLSFCEDTYLKI